MTTALKLTNVGKIFRTRSMETAALRDLSLTIETGEFVAITGASGSGKSTLVTLMGLLDTPSTGQLEFFGSDVTCAGAGALADLRLSKIGFVFQSFHLIPDLTVVANVALGLEGLVSGRRERFRQAHQALERLELAPRADHYPAQLSGGQQQRVAIARAMVRRPALLICDEPTGNLDVESANIVFELIKDMHAAGATVILVTHDTDLARKAPRQVQLEHGEIVNA